MHKFWGAEKKGCVRKCAGNVGAAQEVVISGQTLSRVTADAIIEILVKKHTFKSNYVKKRSSIQ